VHGCASNAPISAIALEACASKQYALSSLLSTSSSGGWHLKERIQRAWRPVLVFGLVSAAFILPWLIDNPSAFVQDVLGYHSGMVLNSYPINGFCLTSLLYVLGVIKRITDPFPSVVIQMFFIVPLTIGLLVLQWRDNTLRRAFFNYAILMAAVIFFAGRHMNHQLLFPSALGMLLKELWKPCARRSRS
jgi:hypothetical protein